MNSPKTYLALFDLDRTIFSTNSGNILVREAYKHKLMSGREFLKAIYLGLSYRLEVRDTMVILEEMAQWIKGIPENELQKLAEHVIEKYLIKKIRPEIYQEIKMHKERGAQVGILSAALAVICEPIARLLVIEDVICSDMEIVEGIYTGKVEGRLCFGEQKLIRLKAYCNINEYDLQDTFYYADSISDKSVLYVVGHPICVDPDRRLKNLATKNNWEIAAWV